MNTIDELKAYCEVDNPVGALLLTGEWGCGKTYLIENKLVNELQFGYVFIRISMFGIETVAELHRVVKNAWIHKCGGVKEAVTVLDNFRESIRTVKEMLSIKLLKNATDALLTIDYASFINIENKIKDHEKNKKVILVFDDFERGSLTPEQKLGVINDYCENQHFNVIVICDENQINDEKYKEFKEKVIQKTVCNIPNYSEIVASVINRVKNSDYKTFLCKYIDELTALLAGTDLNGKSLNQQSYQQLNRHSSMFENSEKERKRREELIKKRAHNIRILISSIQDFERLYNILNKKGASDIQDWLYTFLAFNMGVKSNRIKKAEDGTFSSVYRDMEVLYPGIFSRYYLPPELFDWVFDGVYEEKAIASMLEKYYAINKNSPPKDQVKYYRLDSLEECIAIQGMKDVLQEAYQGELDLNEYIYFIINSHLAREYQLVDLDIHWDKVKEGIRRRIDSIIERREQLETIRTTIGDEVLSDYSEEEKSAYNIIKNVRDSSLTMFEINRKEYISRMKESPDDAFAELYGKRYKCFDEEMAYATAEAFKNVDNMMKAQFPGYFEGMWQYYKTSFDVGVDGVEKSRKGFLTLKECLQNLMTEYSDQPFKKKYTESFISVVEKLLTDEEETSGNE